MSISDYRKWLFDCSIKSGHVQTVLLLVHCLKFVWIMIFFLCRKPIWTILGWNRSGFWQVLDLPAITLYSRHSPVETKVSLCFIIYFLFILFSYSLVQQQVNRCKHLFKLYWLLHMSENYWQCYHDKTSSHIMNIRWLGTETQFNEYIRHNRIKV